MAVAVAIAVGFLLPTGAATLGSVTPAATPADSATTATGSALGTALLAHADQSLAAGAGPAASAPSWAELNSTGGSPSNRDQAPMAYDPAHHDVVLFGGYNSSVRPYGDTWVFSGGLWSRLNLSPPSAPAPRWGNTMVWDAADGYLLLFGGRNLTQFFNDTWTFNGTGWTQVPTSTAPSPRSYLGLSYDALDGYVVGEGGAMGNVPAGSGSAWHYYNDTWSFKSGTWTNRTSSAGSPGLILWTAYDAADHEVVGVGAPTPTPGQSCWGSTAYTWTYANGSWANLSRSGNLTTPSGIFPAIAYDAATSNVILFGGRVTAPGGCYAINSTWSFSGGAWTNRTAQQPMSPLPRDSAAMTYDAAQATILLFGGVDDQTQAYLADTWAYGAAPLALQLTANRSSGPAPLAVGLSASVGGGVAPYTFFWAFGDGSNHTGGNAANHTYTTVGRYVATVTVRDSNANTTFASISITATNRSTTGSGGTNRTTGWLDLTSTLRTAPDVRDIGAMAYDPALRSVVLFGGYSPLGYAFGDTWLFSNGTWTDISSLLLNSPPARWGARMVWDVADGYLLLFGGRNMTQFFNDTWKFTGSTWSSIPTTRSPSPRGFFEFADDPIDGYVLLYGGGIGNVPAGAYSPWRVFNDTWSYSAGNWTNRSSFVVGSPGPRVVGSLVYDARDNYTFLYGGAQVGHPPGNCSPVGLPFSYRNNAWTNRTVTNGSFPPPPPLSSLAMVYADVVHAVFEFGGNQPAGNWCASINGTYQYSAGHWTNLTGTPSPTPRDEAMMAYDAAANVTVFFGGNTETGAYYNDTWIYRYPGVGNSSGNSSKPGSGLPLNATASESTGHGVVPLAVQFSAVATQGSPPYSFSWRFGDGGVAASPGRTEHIYTVAGNYSPRVTVTDSTGGTVSLVLDTIHALGTPIVPGPHPAPKSAFASTSVLALYLGSGAAVGGLIAVGLLLWRRRRTERELARELVQSLQQGPPAEPPG